MIALPALVNKAVLTTPTRDDKIWAAAFFDGEGHVGIHSRKPRRVAGRRTYIVQVAVTNTYHAILLWHEARWGGHVSQAAIRINPSLFLGAAHNFFSTTASWAASHQIAERYLRDIQPFVKIKKAMVANALEFCGLRSEQYGMHRALDSGVYAEQVRLHDRHNALSQAMREGRGRVPFRKGYKP